MIDLYSEFGMATDNIKTPHIERLESLGVSQGTLFSGASVVGACRVQAYRDGTWAPSPSGKPALIVPVGFRGPKNIIWQDVFDLAAVFLGQPDKWFLRLKVGAVLGEEEIERAHIFHEPLTLVGNPLAWLKTETRSACILDWSINLSLILGSLRDLICDSAELANRVHQSLSKPGRSPNIHVAREALNVAA